MTNESGLSNYLFNMHPGLYGGQQEDYLHRSNAIIDEGVKRIREGVEGGKDLGALFREILSYFQTSRGEIARDHKTKDAEQFGKSRLSKDMSNPFYSTPLANPYDMYNAIYLNQLEEGLKTGKKKWKIEDSALGRKSRFDVEVLTNDDLLNILDQDEKVLQKLLKTQKSYMEILADQDLMRSLKTKDVEVYKAVFFNTLLSDYLERYPGQLRENVVFGMLKLEMNGKMYTFSRYFSTFSNNASPVQSIKKSPSLIGHQDIFLLEDTLKEVSSLFAATISSDRNDLPQLKDRVKLFRYYFSHYTPSIRGDGAIGDWLELAIYRYHGYAKTCFNQKFLPCFESLAAVSLSVYANKYDTIVSIQ